jgi:hypothetical protein
VSQLNSGVLTHKVTRQSKFSVNITGWHLGWNYQGLDRRITEAEQRIIPEANGHLSIITTFDMQKEKERKRNGERVYTNLLLRFIGESHHSSLTFSPIAPSPLKNLAAPTKATLNQTELIQLSTLFFIEESVVKGMRELAGLIQSKQKLNPRDFEKAMGDFGSALKSYDNFDEGDNTIFAIVDKLIDRYAGDQHRNSSLELKSTVDGRTVTKMLVA